jgi:hypothetical protein
VSSFHEPGGIIPFVSTNIGSVEKDHIHGDMTLPSASILLSISCNGAKNQPSTKDCYRGYDGFRRAECRQVSLRSLPVQAHHIHGDPCTTRDQEAQGRWMGKKFGARNEPVGTGGVGTGGHGGQSCGGIGSRRLPLPWRIQTASSRRLACGS